MRQVNFCDSYDGKLGECFELAVLGIENEGDLSGKCLKRPRHPHVIHCKLAKYKDRCTRRTMKEAIFQSWIGLLTTISNIIGVRYCEFSASFHTAMQHACAIPKHTRQLNCAPQAFWASERLGRLGEDTIYVKLKDGRGWVFESLNGKKVLERMTLSSMDPMGDTGDEDDARGGARSPHDCSAASRGESRG